MDMICFMHEGNPYGYLKVKEKVILRSNLARMCGLSLDETCAFLEELHDAGVYDVDDANCIFSRRMIRDEEIRNARAMGGKKGGNPSLMGSKVNLKVENEVNQKPTPSSSSSSSSIAHTHPDLRDVLEYAKQIGLAEWKATDWWHEMEGAGWLDYSHRPIQKWRYVLVRVKTKWEADGCPMTPPTKNPKQAKPTRSSTYEFGKNSA